MIAEGVLIVWVIVALVSGNPQPMVGVYPSEATCRMAAAGAEAKMAEDGDDGDALSQCIKVEIKQVKSGPKA